TIPINERQRELHRVGGLDLKENRVPAGPILVLCSALYVTARRVLGRYGYSTSNTRSSETEESRPRLRWTPGLAARNAGQPIVVGLNDGHGFRLRAHRRRD